MANYTQEQQHTERDHKIWRDRTTLGLSHRQLGDKYGLSHTRIQQILQRENKKLKNAVGKGGAVL